VAPWAPNVFDDPLYYRTLASLIAQGKGFVQPAAALNEGMFVPTAHRAPLYPLVLAGVTKLGGTGPDALRLVGVMSGAGSIVALGFLGRRLAGARAGLLAAGLAAIYPTLIAADGALMTESLYGFLAALMLLSAYRLQEAPGPWRAIVLGLVAGLAALTRAEALLLLPLVLVPIERRPAGVRAAAIVCLAFAVVLVPWTARNWIAFDQPVLLATEGGETIAGANCGSSYYGDRIGGWQTDCVRSGRGDNEAAEMNEAGRDGVRYARAHVDRLPLVAGFRLGRTWGYYDPLQTPEGRSRRVVVLGVAMYAVLLALAVYGFVVLRRRGVSVWILMSPFIAVTIVTVLTYGNARFRQSAELSLVVLAAVALDGLLPHRAKRRGMPAPEPVAS
jgi:4-amino-4-deoxy-L-arabinose transferase-like glycosyltransferase